MLGASVGKVDGDSVVVRGKVVGAAVGERVGDTDGDRDGDTVGDTVGDTDSPVDTRNSLTIVHFANPCCTTSKLLLNNWVQVKFAKTLLNVLALMYASYCACSASNRGEISCTT